MHIRRRPTTKSECLSESLKLMNSHLKKSSFDNAARANSWAGIESFCLFSVIILIISLPFSVLAGDKLELSQPLTVRWEYKSDHTINLTPATHQDLVYLPLTGGALVSLRVADGGFLWKTEIGGEFSASPAADERGVYVASATGLPASTAQEPRATGAIRALGRATGVTLWMRTLQSPLRGALALNRDILFAGSSDGRVYAMRKDNGATVWVMQHPAAFASHPVLSGDRLYIGSEDGTLFALEQATGRVLWRYRTRAALRGPVAIGEGMVFFGSADNYVYALSERDGRLRWRVRTGAGVQAVTITASGLVVASLDNFAYFLSLRRGDRLWKRQLPGRIASQPLALADGALFAPLAGDACVALDLRDGRQVNRLPVGEDNNTAAAPVVAGHTLLVTTRRGLLAFTAPDPGLANEKNISPPKQEED